MTPHPTAQLVLTPLRAAAPVEGGTLDVLVRVQAPQRPPEEAALARKPLRLALVIDRSGSMSGEPLREALRCTEYIAAGLTSSDEVAVVLYDDQVNVALPLSRAGDPARVRAALAGVESGGSTALFDGWEAGARCLEAGKKGAISRVLLLSDGQANHGLCELHQIQQHCARWAATGVTTTTVGLGPNFNENLMIGMAQAGSGQNYYGRTADDLHDSFDEELELLKALFLRRLAVKLVPSAGVIPEVLGLPQTNEQGAYTLPDLAWGAEAWMVVRLHIAPAGKADPRQPQALLAVSVAAESDAQAEPFALHSTLALPLVPASDAKGLPIEPLVEQRVKELDFAKAAAQMHALISQGQVGEAKKVLARLERQVGDHPWLADKVAGLKDLIERDVAMSGKELQYSVMRSNRRLASVSEGIYSGSETEKTNIPAFLRRKSAEGQGRKRQK